jgi:hypothetical protein
MKRHIAALALALICAPTLTACSFGSEGKDLAGSPYCKDLGAAKKSLARIEGGDIGALGDAATLVHTLEGEAPDDVSDDWTVIAKAFDDILQGFEAAGVHAEDLAGLNDGQFPEGVDVEALQNVLTLAQTLTTSDDFKKSDANVTKEAKDACGIDLSSS